MRGPSLHRLALIAAAGWLAIAAPPAAAREPAPARLHLAEESRAPSARTPAPLSDLELAGITGGAAGPALAERPSEQPGVRLWDEFTPPAARPRQDGEVTLNGVRLR
jgi:hypothetical protein